MDSHVIPLRMNDEELAALDRVRGGAKRGTWIKGLVASAVAARTAHGAPCALKVVVDARMPQNTVATVSESDFQLAPVVRLEP